jgi:hypothetical protein
VNTDTDPGNDEDDDKTIDSPRENMAIYQELMMNGLDGELSFLGNYGYTNADVLKIANGAIAGAADKTSIVVVDEVQYVNRWIIDWNNVSNSTPAPLPGQGGDERGFKYYDFRNYQYNRQAEYGDKMVMITELLSNGTYITYKTSILQALIDRDLWTDMLYLVDYTGNTNVSGFAKASDDAVQVIEFLHSSTLIQYAGCGCP